MRPHRHPSSGAIVECGTASQIFSHPKHEYTQRLMAALPRILLTNKEPEPKTEAAAAR